MNQYKTDSFRIDDEVAKAYPGLRVALLFVEALPAHSAEQKAAKEQDVIHNTRIAHADAGRLSTNPFVDFYTSFYRKMGLKPARVSTPVKQALRVLETSHYHNIFSTIDECMKIEYQTLISFQVFDENTITFPLIYGFSDGTETITALNGEQKLCKPGELILADATGVINSSYYGNAKRASVSLVTKHAVVRILGVPGCGESFNDAVEQAAKAFKERIARIVVGC